MDFDDQIEQEMRQRNLTAPLLTKSKLEAKIRQERYYRFPGTTVTVCLLIMENGYCVIGESAPASLKNFDADIGRRVARQHARDKLWALEGYLLRQKLKDAEKASQGVSDVVLADAREVNR